MSASVLGSGTGLMVENRPEAKRKLILFIVYVGLVHGPSRELLQTNGPIVKAMPVKENSLSVKLPRLQLSLCASKVPMAPTKTHDKSLSSSSPRGSRNDIVYGTSPRNPVRPYVDVI